MCDVKSVLKDEKSPQCQYFVLRKKRLCRMTVRPGQQYCGEHQPNEPDGKQDARVPCPNDPKHSCFVRKLEKHLSICNARKTESPPYIEENVNAPAAPSGSQRRPLSEIPPETIQQVIEKVDALYEKHVAGAVEDGAEDGEALHAAVARSAAWHGGGAAARRHLRQASRLLQLAEQARLVRPRTCYAELGAGKGQLSYYMGVAWCGAGEDSCVLAVDRAALRHKRDNKLRPPPGAAGAEAAGAEAAGAGVGVRLRAELAHVALQRVPCVRGRALVGLAKHLCGAATDYALRSLTAAAAAGAVLATCCHHRCDAASCLAAPRLRELGVTEDDFNVMLGVVSWATCGSGRGRGAGAEAAEGAAARARRAESGRRAKLLLDWGRAESLRRAAGYRARLVRFVPAADSLENIAIVATAATAARLDHQPSTPEPDPCLVVT